MSTYTLVDSHCHFDFSAFDVDRAAVWQACQQQHIQHLIIPGVSPSQWETAKQLCEQFTGLHYSVGLHPWWINDWLQQSDLNSTSEAQLITLLSAALEDTERRAFVVAVGECGLDGMIDTPLKLQRKILACHLSVAKQFNKPVIIHCRKAHNELIRELKNVDLPAGGVIHGFSGSLELAESYGELGFRLGIGGTITYDRAKKTRVTVRDIPLSQLILETDAPDMPLQGGQGKRNSPLYLTEIATCLAQLRDDSLENIANQTTRNAKDLFAISGQ